MTVSELYSQVACLGFEGSLEDGNGFYHSANRALSQVGSLRPAVSACEITHSPLPNLLDDFFSPIEKPSDKTLVFEADGAKAFYFEANGKGSYKVEALDDKGFWRECGDGEFYNEGNPSPINSKFLPVRDFIKRDGDFVQGRIKLTISGEYLFSVRCVALYKDVYSEKQIDIPALKPSTEYDMAEISTDFVSFACPPIEFEGYDKMRTEYGIEGSKLLLPRSYSGVVRVLYNRKRKELEPTEYPEKDATLLDLDPELCTLLPLLVASYVWLEDEEAKASYYMNLYRERAAEIERKNRSYAPIKIKNIYGW
jgi:hypothetical protein